MKNRKLREWKVNYLSCDRKRKHKKICALNLLSAYQFSFNEWDDIAEILSIIVVPNSRPARNYYE